MIPNHALQGIVRLLTVLLTLGALVLVTACVEEPSDDDSSSSSSSDTYDGDGVTISIDYPDTLTGGTVSGSSSLTRNIAGLGGRADNCFYKGNEFWWVNGYNMTQFLIGTSATWTCISESLITLAVLLPLPSGVFIDISDEDDEEGDATGLRYTKDGDINVFEFFYNGSTTESDVWVAWKEVGDTVEGRLILTSFDADEDEDELEGLRVDFLKGETEETASLYVSFAESTELIGFRADVVHDLSGDFPAYTAKGIVELRSQWSDDFEDAGIDDVPDLRIITYADDDGAGATIGSFIDAGLSLNDGSSDYGLYLFDKDDFYYFDEDGEDEYINKSITFASYEGERGDDIDASDLDDVEALLDDIDGDYFDTFCIDETADLSNDARDCTDFLQALFTDVDSEDEFGLEVNAGTEPSDARKDLIDAVDDDDFLDESLPDGVFDHEFTPSI